MDRLFSLLSDCMWEAPVAQAKHSVQVKERVQELKLQVCTTARLFRSSVIDRNVGNDTFVMGGGVFFREKQRRKMRSSQFRRCPSILRRLSVVWWKTARA